MAGIASTTQTEANAPAKSKKRAVMDAAKKLSPAKAAKILHDGTIRGKPITDRQRRFFGWRAGGSK